jgi:predicted metal-dependent phosphoesterase TrpH
MILDLHCHSVVSDDSRASVEQYAKWIGVLRKKGYRVDGIILTEHRTFDRTGDYRDLEDKYELLILKASELDTNCGHMLVYGVNDHLLKTFDFKNVRMDAPSLVREAEVSGAIVVPAHPGRERVGFVEFVDKFDFSPVVAVEQINGGSKAWENERAEQLVAQKNYHGIGGSDAHFVNAIGSCLTQFQREITTIEDLVAELRAGDYRAIRLEATKAAAGAA